MSRRESEMPLHIFSRVALTATVLLGAGHIALATQLHVEPVLLEMNAPAAAGSLTLHNEEGSEVAVQTRILRWSQRDGTEALVPTTDVVVSPPTIKLAPGSDNIVRVVRVSKQPINGEESYRVIVDQLPDLRARQGRAVNILIRQSIPVFFRNPQLSPPNVAWSYHHEGGKLIVAASNGGDERLRIASLRLRDEAGESVFFGNGLVGYVLGHSSMNWSFPTPPKAFGMSGSVSVAAQSDKGPVNAVATIRDRR